MGMAVAVSTVPGTANARRCYASSGCAGGLEMCLGKAWPVSATSVAHRGWAGSTRSKFKGRHEAPLGPGWGGTPAKQRYAEQLLLTLPGRSP